MCRTPTLDLIWFIAGLYFGQNFVYEKTSSHSDMLLPMNAGNAMEEAY